MELRGVCPIAPAVFKPTGEIDYDDYERCCAEMIALGAEALTLFGIAGEYYKLDRDEEEELIVRTVRACRAGGARCVISNTRHATETAVPWAKRIEDAGADAMMVLPPFFLKPGGAPLMDHLDAVCASVRLPVMLQYAPEQTGVAIAVDALAALAARHGNLRYFKVECRPPGHYLSALREKLPSGRSIFVGNAGFHMIEGHRRGAAGVMPGPSMVDVYVRIWRALDAGDEALAQRLHNRLNALLNHIRQNVEMIIHYEKRILARRGLAASAYCRRPGHGADACDDALFETLYAALEEEMAP